jgi:hypothetical protein
LIYAVSSDLYPKEGQFIEEIIYKDENDFEWRIARIENGFIVKYFGDPYFLDSTFECELSNGEWISIPNSNCIFFNNPDFDVFCNVRDIIKNGYTDYIQEVFTDLFTERFEHDMSLMASEIKTN